jgi:hypothetical protein
MNISIDAIASEQERFETERKEHDRRLCLEIDELEEHLDLAESALRWIEAASRDEYISSIAAGYFSAVGAEQSRAEI